MKIVAKLVLLLVLAAGICYFALYPIALPDAALNTVAFPERERFAAQEGARVRGHLDAREQLIYDAVYGAVQTCEPSVTVRINNFTPEQVERAIMSVLYDSPELFWVDFTNSYYTVTQAGTTVTLSYLYTQQQLEEMRAELDDALETLVAKTRAQGFTSDLETALYVHDYINMRCTYDESMRGENVHNAYGALVDCVTVCDGYAHAYQLALETLGIECHYVGGVADGEYGEAGHAWNIARLDGVYTHIDLTWNDKDRARFAEVEQAGDDMVSHAFFALSDEMIARDHVADDMGYALPVCAELDPFALTGLSGESVEDILEPAAQLLCERVLGGGGVYFEVALRDDAVLAAFTESYSGGIDAIIARANELLRERQSETGLDNSVYFSITSLERASVMVLCSTAAFEDLDAEQ